MSNKVNNYQASGIASSLNGFSDPSGLLSAFTRDMYNNNGVGIDGLVPSLDQAEPISSKKVPRLPSSPIGDRERVTSPSLFNWGIGSWDPQPPNLSENNYIAPPHIDDLFGTRSNPLQNLMKTGQPSDDPGIGSFSSNKNGNSFKSNTGSPFMLPNIHLGNNSMNNSINNINDEEIEDIYSNVGSPSSYHSTHFISSSHGNNNNNNIIGSANNSYTNSTNELGVSPTNISTSHGSTTSSTTNTIGNTFGEHPLGEHPSRTLFVRNINSNVEDDELCQLFEQYGPVRNMYTQCKHRGFVMISYYDIRHAKNAMRYLQGKVLRRRKLDIHYSIPKDNPSEKDQNQGTLVVFNLDPTTSNDELKVYFGQYGEIKEIRETPNKKHHKFIEFYDIRDADRAMKSLNKTEIKGKKIKIEPSRPGGARKGSSIGGINNLNDNLNTFQTHSLPSSGGFTLLDEDNYYNNNANNNISISLPGPGPADNFTLNSMYSSSLGHDTLLSNNNNNNNNNNNSNNNSANDLLHQNYYSSSAPGSTKYGINTISSSIDDRLMISNNNNNSNNNTKSRSSSFSNPFGYQPIGSSPPTTGLLSNNNNNNNNSGINSNGGLWGISSAIHSTSPRNNNYNNNYNSNINNYNNNNYSGAVSPVPNLSTTPSSNLNSNSYFKPLSFGSNSSLIANVNNSNNNNLVIATSPPTNNLTSNNNNNNINSNNNNGFLIDTLEHRASSPTLKLSIGMSEVNLNETRRHRSHSIEEDKSKYILVIDKVVNLQDLRTTLMIKNIPNKYSQKMLLAAVDDKFRGTYDFFYLPIDFRNKCNVGYAFINFITTEFIVAFYEEYNNKKWEKFNSEKVCEITYARIQGKQALVAHFQNSSLMCEDKKCRPIIFHEGEPESFPSVSASPRRNRSSSVSSTGSRDE